MTSSKRTPWPSELKRQALELWRSDGPAAASKATGIPAGTIGAWVTRAALQPLHRNRVPVEALEVLREQRAARREELELRMLDTALRLVKRIEEPHVELVSSGGVVQPVELPVAPAKAAREYATAAAILLDKYRLERGEATDRTEHGSVQPLADSLSEQERRQLRDWLDSVPLEQLAAGPQAPEGGA